MRTEPCLGCNFIEISPVTLRTGEVVCSSCEAWRIETEARYVVKMEGKGARTKYLNGVDKQRGKVAGAVLREEVLAQWALLAAVADAQSKAVPA